MSIRSMTIGTTNCRAAVDEALGALRENRVVERILLKDYTLWKPDPEGIVDRLGWLNSPLEMRLQLAGIEEFVDAVRADGYDFALLMGMGGSSLAPEVFRKVFGRKAGFLELAVIDSTTTPGRSSTSPRVSTSDGRFSSSPPSPAGRWRPFLPQVLLQPCRRDAWGRGGGEALHRHHRCRQHAVRDGRGARIPSLLPQRPDGRRALFGPFSLVGLVPGALIGMDMEGFVGRSAVAAEGEFASHDAVGEESGALLGALLGGLAMRGRDKLTFLFSPEIAAFGDWVEQLIAESTGKEGKGILPVVGEPLGPPSAYGDDRIFVAVRVGEDRTGEVELGLLARAGHPVVEVGMVDLRDLGAQCFFWEMATAVAGWRLAINPFDQPDVEAAKQQARRMIGVYRETGKLPSEKPSLEAPGISVYGAAKPCAPGAALIAFLEQAGPGAYAAIQAYLRPCPETGAALEALRLRLWGRFGIPVTVGYGPRFLHSTGQLHKGDAGRGLFIQLTADDPRDAPIPDEIDSPEGSLTFGVLKAAQAFGDRQALIDAGRRVIRFHLHDDPAGGIKKLG